MLATMQGGLWSNQWYEADKTMIPFNSVSWEEETVHVVEIL